MFRLPNETLDSLHGHKQLLTFYTTIIILFLQKLLAFDVLLSIYLTKFTLH